jgi:hypothetical protein
MRPRSLQILNLSATTADTQAAAAALTVCNRKMMYWSCIAIDISSVEQYLSRRYLKVGQALIHA